MIHQAIEINGSRAVCRAVKGAGVVIHANRAVVDPEVQPRFVIGVGIVPRKITLDQFKMAAQPFSVMILF